MIVFMLKHLRMSACAFTTDSIQCHDCPTDLWGGFSPEWGILLCQNRFPSKKYMEDTLAHELIHAFDHCQFNVDWSKLRHHACSEVGRVLNASRRC
jgi:inner membrane protease ATP23